MTLTPVFFFDLGAKFPEILKYAIKDLHLQFIGINYRRYTDAVHSYEAMRDVYDKDIAFFVANTMRADESNGNVSTMHYLPFLSNDIFSSYIPTPRLGPGGEESPQTKLSKVQWFDRDSVKLNKITERFNPNKILKEVQKSNDEQLRDMLENYESAGEPNQELKLSRLKAFTKVHEVIASTSEFVTLQKHIKDHSTKDYVDEAPKQLLKRIVTNIH